MGKTMAEKILARAAGANSVRAGEIIDAKPDCVMTHEPGSALVTKGLDEIGVDNQVALENIVIQIGHSVPTITGRADMQNFARKLAKRLNVPWFYDSNHGICHQVLIYKGHALPGQLVIATDSHTTTCGCVGAFSCGVGASEMSYIMAFGYIWLKVPESIRIWLTGSFKKGVSAKDLILYLSGKYGTDMAEYMAIEFDGPSIKDFSMDSRQTLCAMSVELGAKTGMVVPDDVTYKFSKAVAKKSFEPLVPDKNANYQNEIIVKLDDVEPMVAYPHDVSNVRSISQAESETIEVNVASIGTCANGAYEDMELAAEILAGKNINKNVRLFIIPSSIEAYQQALKSGVVQKLVDAGAIVSYPSCGLCAGLVGVLVPGEKCIAAHNRNFMGRMGSTEADIYLSSPATVAASALTGKITDPRNYL